MKRGLPFLFALCCVSVTGAAQLRIFHLDVEQGEATLFVSPGGHTLLVDSGKNGHGARIKALLDQLGLSRIDHFVNTHYHEDHYGGIDELVADPTIEVVQAYDRGDKDCCLPASKRAERNFRNYEDAIGHRATHLMRGETIPLDPAMSVICIASGGVVLGEHPPEPGHDENDLSVALLIHFGAFRYFVGGDIEAPTETKIAQLDQVGEVDVYLADHHGSHSSSTPEFLAELSPTVIVISNGSNALYKHPRQSTLTAMASLSPVPAIFQTNRYLRDDPEAGNVPLPFIADPESADTDGLITITVGEAQYTVAFGGASHVFDIKGAALVAQLRIERVLPDPSGDERQNEAIVLRNVGTASQSLEGWRLQDEGGRVWLLGDLGSVAAGQELLVQRGGMAMGLNNDRDEILLIDAGDVVRDRFAYEHPVEGVWIERAP